MGMSEKLRQDRLVFYQTDMERIDRVLAEFLRLSAAKCALLIDKGGHLVTRKGDVKEIDMDTISALVAGSFAATREMARVLGEDEFAVLFHQGKTDNIQLSLVGDRTLLTVIFDEATTVGMVRLYAAETVKRLAELFEKHEREIESGVRKVETLETGFAGSAKDKLDDLFGA